jgi:hypothetical protein
MTPSNLHSGTAARGLRRAFLLQIASGLLTALFAAPATVPAQNVIQFSLGYSAFTEYQVRDDGSNLRTLPFPQGTMCHTVYASAQSSYPGGRQFLYPQQDGLLPNGNPSYDLMVWSEATGQSKPLTNIHGPLYVYFPSARWSNDGLDSFVSFILYTPTNENYTYRAHVSAADIASPTFQPITLGDPRLELVRYWGVGGTVGYWYWWNHDGSGFYYVDAINTTRIRFMAVGGGDMLVYTAPAQLGELRVIPPVDPLNPDRYAVATALPIGTGILAIDLHASTSWWLATGPGGIGEPRGPCFSPDGSLIAFGNTVYGSKKTPYYGVYKVPFFGGPITGVFEVMGSSKTAAYPTVCNWNTP